MRIRSITIDSFGSMRDRKIDDLSKGFNVIYGKNEAGKTTIMEFIRSTLFSNRQRKTYPAYSKSDSGKIIVEMDDGSIVSIDRGDEPVIRSIDYDTYRSVYAMTPNDLRESTIITSGDIKKRFLTVPGGSELPRVTESIEKEMLSLLTTDRRSTNTLIGSDLADLEGVRTTIDSNSENSDYDHLFKEKIDLENAAAQLMKRKDELDRSKRIVDLQNSQLENIERLNSIKEEIDGLSASDVIKEGDKEAYGRRKQRVNEQKDTLKELEEKTSGHLRSLAGMDPEKILMNRSRIRDLSGSTALMSDLQRQKLDLMNSLEREKQTPEPIKTKQNSNGSNIALSVALIVCGLILTVFAFTQDIVILAAGTLLIPLGAYFAFKAAKAGSGSIEPRVNNTTYVREKEAALNTVNNRIALLESDLDRLADVLDLKRSSYNNDVALLSDLLEKSTAYDDSARRCKSAELTLKENESELRTFLSAFGGEQQFLDLCDMRSKKIGLEQRRKELENSIASSGYDPNVAVPHIDDATDPMQEIEETNRKIGEVKQKMDSILKDRELDSLRDRKALLESEIGSNVRRWGVLSVATSLIDTACRNIYSDVQPDVVRTADHYINTMTVGRYGLNNDPRSDEISVISKEGSKIKGQWSSGLGDQIILSLKLAVARELSQEKLPVLLDDVLLMFDSERKRGGCAALMDASNEMQIILFTCDRETRDLAVEAGGHLIDL